MIFPMYIRRCVHKANMQYDIAATFFLSVLLETFIILLSLWLYKQIVFMNAIEIRV